MIFRLAYCMLTITLCSSLLSLGCHGFVQIASTRGRTRTITTQYYSTIIDYRNDYIDNDDDKDITVDVVLERRHLLQQLSAGAFVIPSFLLTTNMEAAWASSDNNAAVVMNKDDPNTMFAPKFVQQYEDFIMTPEGWSYRDVKPGNSNNVKAQLNDRVVYDWSGYTIGYFGRPFQAKGGPQGGAFDKELDYERTVLGSGAIVKGLECAMVGMSAGAVRQVVIPFEKDLSYPLNDLDHTRVGPKPSTFSGQRALNFVLENPRIDRTLLFNVKVIRVDKPNGSGGFVRG